MAAVTSYCPGHRLPAAGLLSFIHRGFLMSSRLFVSSVGVLCFSLSSCIALGIASHVASSAPCCSFHAAIFFRHFSEALDANLMECFFYIFRRVTCPSSPLTRRLSGREAALAGWLGRQRRRWRLVTRTGGHKTRLAHGDNITCLLPGVFTSTLSVDEINKVNLPGD